MPKKHSRLGWRPLLSPRLLPNRVGSLEPISKHRGAFTSPPDQLTLLLLTFLKSKDWWTALSSDEESTRVIFIYVFHIIVLNNIIIFTLEVLHFVFLVFFLTKGNIKSFSIYRNLFWFWTICRRGNKHFDVHLWRIMSVRFLSQKGKSASYEGKDGWKKWLFPAKVGALTLTLSFIKYFSLFVPWLSV